MSAPDYTDLSLSALTWNEAEQISCAELTGAHGEKLYLDLDSLDAAELVRLIDHPHTEKGRVHSVLIELLIANKYNSEAVFLSFGDDAQVHCRLLFQKRSSTGFLELRPGDGLVVSQLLQIPVYAHRALLAFVDSPSTTVG